MTLNLKLVHETDAAVLYEYRTGVQIWVPRSVIKSRIKLAQPDLTVPRVHIVTVEDWWWEKSHGKLNESEDLE